ncbi:MAG: tyrosine--tRNA ligase [Chloroflexi bacterium RBG_13_52_12]|nr:MAG: tyrosine--tRNA ligase [Chloroflexi bacterium RBG_13_52_12]
MQGSEFGDPQIKEMMTKELRQRLLEAKNEGRPLRIYCGYDVTAPDLHLGHTITIRKLRQFQDYGHDVTFLIGTFTTLIGDPSDRDEARAMALQEQVSKNAKTYAEQAFKILDRKKTSVRYNYDWLSKLTFMDVISMASCFTVQQFMARDRIRNRLEKNDPIWLREFLYPLAQGYDAVQLKADVQLGATEQLFNLMAGRRLQEAFGQKPLVCLTFPVLVGTDGVDRMSKSRGNYIGIAEPPEDIYGKTMSIPDGIIIQYYELLTNVSIEELADFKKQMASGVNPMSLKKRLAKTLVTQFYSEKDAQEAEAHFEKTVQNKELPDDITEYVLQNDIAVSQLLAQSGLSASRSEAMRLIKQGAVTIDGKKISNANETVSKGVTIKVGKRRYLRTI